MSRDMEILYVGLLCSDMERSLDFYTRLMHLRLVGRFSRAGEADVALLCDADPASRIMVRLAGPPFTGWMREDFKAHGPGLDCLAFVGPVPEPGGKTILSEMSREKAMEPGLCCPGTSLRDADGIHVRLLSSDDVLPIDHCKTGYEPAIHYRLSHTCITTRDIYPQLRFYTEGIGLSIVNDRRDEGLIFLGGPGEIGDPSRHVFPVELLGPPGLWPPDEDFVSRHGPGVSYLCFGVGDVDVESQRLVDTQIHCTLEPMNYRGYRLAFFKDPDGIDLEILHPAHQI